jgi:hypothetical protein
VLRQLRERPTFIPLKAEGQQFAMLNLRADAVIKVRKQNSNVSVRRDVLSLDETE